MTFEVYGLRVACDFPLPELSENRVEAAAGIHVYRATHSIAACVAETPSHVLRDARGQRWVEVFVRPTGYLVRFPDLGNFELRDQGALVSYQVADGLPRDSLAHLLLDHVLPLVAQLRGALCFHATAVASPSGVHAFVGPTGTGKSTLAAALVQRGAQLVADDCLALRLRSGQWWASPGYAGVRLHADVSERWWPDRPGARVAHYAQKRRIVPPTWPARLREARPLRSVCLLHRAPNAIAPTFERPRPADAAATLTANSFRLDLRNRQALRRELGMLRHLTDTVWLRRLVLGTDLDALPASCEEVLERLGT